jgi:hypothetical protein
MIHCAEAVLPGHPDKFCDRIADAIVAEAMAADPFAFAQIEVGIWSDEAWLSGNIVTRTPLKRSPAEILVQTGLSLDWTVPTGSMQRATGSRTPYAATSMIPVKAGKSATTRAL